jgi:hypothetical protein
MTGRRDFPPPPPLSVAEKLPVPQRHQPQTAAPAEPQPVAPEPQPTLADELREAAERGVAGTLLVDQEAEASGSGIIANALMQLCAVGHFARDGRGPAATAVIVGRTHGAGRYVVQVGGLGGQGAHGDWLTLPSDFAPRPGDGPITVLEWLEPELAALHREGVPMAVVLEPECLPRMIGGPLAAKLASVASSVPACVAVVSENPGCVPVVQFHEGFSAVRLRPGVAPGWEASR